jgi:hypothetical protein
MPRRSLPPEAEPTYRGSAGNERHDAGDRCEVRSSQVIQGALVLS